MALPPDHYESGELPPTPAAVDAVIMREPCKECGEAAFGYVTCGELDGREMHAVTEYHEDSCPVLKDGAFVILTMPGSAVPLAGQITDAIFGGGPGS
jgi:hypothetical protein